MCVLGIRTDEPAVFANSWAVDLPHERACPSVDLDFGGPCQSESDMDVSIAYYEMICIILYYQLYIILTKLYLLQCVQDAIEKCSALLFFPFLSCHENIDPNPFVASCVSDLCV